MSAQARSDVRALLERHGIRPAKSWGQHFLVDPNITRKIVAVAGIGPGDGVVEIGAGTGTLTLALAGAGAD
ncbi:MAG TPA: rRNA adenine N-6-methyltransferase family protein, partial [Acidimicrobiia bacterium]|nr:rRNA adenine N-6-methyltransferase family protein [Acidimicrobiia bacterium]